MFLQCVGILFQFHGLSFIIKNNNCSIFHKEVFYANAYLQDGIYVMNLQKSNNSHVYNITIKKLNPMI